jgi:hypothetical protein
MNSTDEFATDQQTMSEPESKTKVGFLQVASSVLASFFGIQSNERRERDFTHGRARDFILVGVVLTAVFILVVWGVVKLVMHLAGV